MGDAKGFATLGRRLARYPPPLSGARALAIIDRLEVGPEGTLLELGCGTAGFLIDAVRRHGCRGLGVEADAELATAARIAVDDARLSARIEIASRADAGLDERSRFAAIVCLTSGEPYGSPGEIAASARALLAPQGLLVLGAPFLRKPPARGYFELIAPRLPPGAEAPGGAIAQTVVRAGFELLSTMVLAEAEWDAYESASYRALIDYAEAHAGDPEARDIRARAEACYHGYWQHGREVLGFMLHCFARARRPLAVVAPV
jgi:SAM-dependent methyltransferase